MSHSEICDTPLYIVITVIRLSKICAHSLWGRLGKNQNNDSSSSSKMHSALMLSRSNHRIEMINVSICHMLLKMQLPPPVVVNMEYDFVDEVLMTGWMFFFLPFQVSFARNKSQQQTQRKSFAMDSLVSSLAVSPRALSQPLCRDH